MCGFASISMKCSQKAFRMYDILSIEFTRVDAMHEAANFHT
jgi:hypothetical protein